MDLPQDKFGLRSLPHCYPGSTPLFLLRTFAPCPQACASARLLQGFTFPFNLITSITLSSVFYVLKFLFCIGLRLRLHAQLCPTLCNPLDCSPSGSSVHGISQARILKLVTISSSRGSSWPRNWTHVFYVSCIGRWVLYLLNNQGSPYLGIVD